MEIAFVIFLIIAAPLAWAIWLTARSLKAGNDIAVVYQRFAGLERDILKLQQSVAAIPISSTGFEAAAAPPAPRPAPAPAPVEKPVFVNPMPYPKPAPPQPAPVPSPTRPPAPPPIIPPRPEPAQEFFVPAKPAIDWEKFMGIKGFAWIGGFALFLGVAFFVKYSFDNNLVPPPLRAAIGFLVAMGLVIGGLVMSRKDFPVLSRTLCATGVVTLYAVTYACHSFYHFPIFGAVTTFLLMSLVTAGAFILADRLEALVVAILGMLGGFLTPILLSTGQDNPAALFGYIAILDAGLILVALSRRWHFLTAAAAFGTVSFELAWHLKFFEKGKYFAGNKILVAFAVLLGMNALWLAANWLAKRRRQTNAWTSISGFALGLAALGFVAHYLTYPSLAARPGLVFGFVFALDLVVTGLALLEENISAAHPAAGFAVFGLLAYWTQNSLNNSLLNIALGFYFLFGVFHSAFPLLLQRRRGTAGGVVAKMSHLFPLLAVAITLIPIFKFSELSFVVWPFVLLVNLLAIGLSVVTLNLFPVLGMLVLTLIATGGLIIKVPDTLAGLTEAMVLLGAFAVFFTAVSGWLLRKVQTRAVGADARDTDSLAVSGDAATLLACSSTVLPFLLLIMTIVRLPLANPTPVFGIALLLVALLAGLSVIFNFAWLPLMGMLSAFGVEAMWHFQTFEAHPGVSPGIPLAWYLTFYGVFTLFPFLFLRRFLKESAAWIASALAGPAHFLLVYELVKTAWPNQVMGLLPAAFAVPPLLGLMAVRRSFAAENPARLSNLAWFGGVALFFITAIFPIQFHRQWITIGWALEGAALCWLFHRVPHPGLRATALGLLIAAFVRLTLNPAVFGYHPRSEMPLFNWYLYTYGIVTAAFFVANALLAPPRNMIGKSDARPILISLGTVLAFLLMNIEIADYFSAPGSTLTFEFTGNFGRDMTYSIAWALFALGLLVIGIAKKLPGARYASMALLCVTLIKLFVHDLANLGPLYRIGASVGVAIIALLASFAYQKFFTTAESKASPK
jgi:hypothetical protein